MNAIITGYNLLFYQIKNHTYPPPVEQYQILLVKSKTLNSLFNLEIK